MTALVALDPTFHHSCYVLPEQAQRHAAGLQLIPLVPAELSYVAAQQPIVLTKQADSGQFVLSALNGFVSGENLLFAEHSQQWQGLYLPLQLQRQPFFLALQPAAAETTTDSSPQYTLCIDPASPALGQQDIGAPLPAGAQRLWLPDGSDSDSFRQAKGVLAELLQGEQQRAQLIEQLLQLQLIQPLALDITFADHSSLRLQGLYCIDQQRLAALAPDAIVRLHQAGWLPAIYSIIGSMTQLYRLIELKNQQLVAR